MPSDSSQAGGESSQDSSLPVTLPGDRIGVGSEPIAVRLNYLFRRVDDNPTGVELLRQMLAYRTKVSP